MPSRQSFIFTLYAMLYAIAFCKDARWSSCDQWCSTIEKRHTSKLSAGSALSFCPQIVNSMSTVKLILKDFKDYQKFQRHFKSARLKGLPAKTASCAAALRVPGNHTAIRLGVEGKHLAQ